MKTLLLLLCTTLACGFGPAKASSDGAPDIAALEKAAQGGDAAAQFRLGRAYHRGIGVEQDPKKALELIRKAAEAGDLDAIDSMGFLYAKGELVAMDEKQAFKWFERGVKAGSARSKLNLGLMLRQAKTLQASPAESITLMEEAAAAGQPEAKAYLGQLYFLGDQLQKPDRHKAYPYVKAAAEAGDPACQNIMGVFCRDGLGVREDFKESRAEAIEWFRKAAMQNDVKAQSNLAHILGVGSPACEDPKEALKWLIIAMNRGEITAKKTYDELFKTLGSSVLVPAQIEANRFSMLKQAEAEARKNRGGEAAVPAVEAKEDAQSVKNTES
jgi:TPR repeat protein